MFVFIIYSDVDGLYYGLDKKIYCIDGWVNYSIFFLWDIYCVVYFLFIYIEFECINDMV